MKGTLNAFFVDNFAVNPQVGSHMGAIGVDAMNNSLCGSDKSYVVPRYVDSLGGGDWELFSFAGNIPAIRIGGEGPAQSLLRNVVITIHPDREVAEHVIVQEIGDSDEGEYE